jgi:AmmeMemoRadiSam system protein B/AmmeMemoRadiSam system protein A
MFAFILLLIILGRMELMSQDAPSEKSISYRPPTVAGAFYPADADSLNAEIEKYLELDKPKVIPENVKILGIISPHAGYVYSGFVAGKAYRELVGRNIKTVIIISPSHQVYFPYASVFSGDAYVTPLGPVLVDKELANRISSQNIYVKLSMEGHQWQRVTPEHSLEVQIPFVQKVLPNAKIVPIVMGSQENVIIQSLTMAIYKALQNTPQANEVLLIASSDLSHYHSYKTANSIDEKFVLTFSRFDYFKLTSLLNSREVEACGGGPIAVVMSVSEALGANKPVPILYGTSGDSPYAPRMKDQVVGYFAGALTYDPEFSVSSLPKLTPNDKKFLLDLAKKTVEAVAKGEKPDISQFSTPTGSLSEHYTAFVTIEKNGELRACMGHLFPVKPLYWEVFEVAKLSATSDWRFGPVKSQELPELSYEITILSRFKKVFSENEIQIGKHGLFIRYRKHSGLLLPQVASERNWDVRTFLENLCLKAGLSKTTYLDPEAEIFSFEALIIH